MFFFSWLRKRNSDPRVQRATAARPKQTRFRPLLEALEDRFVPSTLTVTNTLDSGTGSLRADLTAAHKGDTIVFNIPKSDPGYASTGVWTITLTSGELDITKNLTITGPGAANLTISGNHASRVFELSSATKPQASLSGMTISNGVGAFAPGSSQQNDGSGGAILNQGTLTISNSILSGNSAPHGGAIHNDGTLTVTGCILTDNSAGNYGFGGAIENNVTLTVSASTLSYNSAYYGGGIFNGGTATVNSGTMLSHNSGTHGGGIFNMSGTVARLTIDGCTLSDNSAFIGGGIFDSSGPVMVSACTLTGNSATVEGGGIYLGGNSATVTIKNSSTITGNTAPAGSGADVYSYGVVYLDSTSTIGILDGNPARPI
jgi:hypothetical protein